MISIHSPRAGRDAFSSSKLWQLVKFQSTRPVRGETPDGGYGYIEPFLFQSTRPVRGETRNNRHLRRSADDFNPLAPCGARPLAYEAWQMNTQFQSTRPVRGETEGQRYQINARRFQSTRPVRGETSGSWVPDPPRGFQSTRPVRGETKLPTKTFRDLVNFNPLAPCGARPHPQGRPRPQVCISIHSPRAGRDRTCRSGYSFRAGHFNPLAPCGARPTLGHNIVAGI